MRIFYSSIPNPGAGCRKLLISGVRLFPGKSQLTGLINYLAIQYQKRQLETHD
jgi:hypothetical protein